MKDENGNTNLANAILKGKSNFRTLRLIKDCPNDIQQKTTNDQYPLHLACEFCRSEKIVLRLLNAFPQAATEKELVNGCYPLHLACEHGRSENIVFKLLLSFPQAIREKDIDLRYPLHGACENRSERVVLRLLNSFPHAATEKDGFGKLPLHSACYMGLDNVVLRLLKEFPQATYEKDITRGWIPLRWASEGDASEHIVLTLIDTNILSVKKLSWLRIGLMDPPRTKKFTELIYTLRKKSDYELENRIDIPMLVIVNGLANRRRQEGYQWLLLNP